MKQPYTSPCKITTITGFCFLWQRKFIVGKRVQSELLRHNDSTLKWSTLYIGENTRWRCHRRISLINNSRRRLHSPLGGILWLWESSLGKKNRYISINGDVFLCPWLMRDILRENWKISIWRSCGEKIGQRPRTFFMQNKLIILEKSLHKRNCSF